jgi:hypothetical protein
MPDELRPHVREDEDPPDDTVVVIRGGPDNADKLARHAARTHRAFELDGEPIWGVSVFLALDQAGGASLEGLLSDRLRTYREVHLPALVDLRAAGFEVIPTFARPHFTLVLADSEPHTLASLLAALGAAVENPYH